MTDSQTYYHGTRADLKVGDLVEPGYTSNYGKRKQATFVYLTATLDAAIWGAELAVGAGHGRIYIVEPTGSIEDDPNLTNKRFPGNPTKSYRSRNPFRILGEVTDWKVTPPTSSKKCAITLRASSNVVLRQLKNEHGSAIQRHEVSRFGPLKEQQLAGRRPLRRRVSCGSTESSPDTLE